MKKRKTITLSIIIVFLISIGSCTKFGKNITIKGRVENPITNKSIPGIKVRLIKSENLQYYGGYKTIKETTTDANGHFELSAGRIGSVWIVIDYNYKDYYDLGWDYDGKYYSQLKVEKGEVMHVDYHLVPYAKLQINIKDTACFNQNDELSIFRTQSIPGFYDNVPNPAVYTGCVDQEGNMNKDPMGWYKYKGTVTKNGVETQVEDSIYLEAHGTKIWNIFY